LLALYLRYKQPDGERSTRLEYPLNDKQALSARASRDFDWTAAVAGFGMIFCNSQYTRIGRFRPGAGIGRWQQGNGQAGPPAGVHRLGEKCQNSARLLRILEKTT